MKYTIEVIMKATMATTPSVMPAMVDAGTPAPPPPVDGLGARTRVWVTVEALPVPVSVLVVVAEVTVGAMVLIVGVKVNEGWRKELITFRELSRKAPDR